MQGVFLCSGDLMRHSPFRLCMLLTRKLCVEDPLVRMKAAVKEGVDMVQVREKEMTAAELFAWGGQVLELGRSLGVPVLINDSVEVAHALDADGVHLGQEDLPAAEARAILGENKLIGLSTHSLDQVEEAFNLPVNYLGFGPIFPTKTKGYTAGLGPDALVHALSLSPLPVLAIGGIHGDNAWKIPKAAGVAVSSAICSTKELHKDCLAMGRFDLY